MRHTAPRPARRTPTTLLVPVLLPVLLGGVLSLAAWLRLDATTRATVWAEDGMFLAERLASGPGRTLLDPYAGYLHLLPRLLVDAAVLAPLPSYAVAVSALSCLAVGVVGALVHGCSAGVVADPRARVVLASLVVLVPPGPIEVLGNTANLHWALLWLAPWLLLARPGRRWAGWALGVVALVVALSEIQAAVWVPLVLLAVRERARRPAALGLLVGVLAQVAVTLASPRPDTGATPTVLDLAKGWLLNVVLPLWRPALDGPGPTYAERGWSWALLLAVPWLLVIAALVALAVGAVRRRAWDLPLLVGVLLVGTAAPLVAGLVLNFQASYAYGSLSPAELADDRPLRYGVVSAVFLLALAVVLADRLLGSGARHVRRVGVVVLTGVLVLGLVHLAGVETRRSRGPAWAPALAEARTTCAGAEVTTPVVVPIAPRRQGWQVRLTCSQLD